METIFALVIAIAIIELILSITWSRFYFKFGIPVFVYEVKRKNMASAFPSSTVIENSLPKSWHVPFKFNSFSSGEIGVREAIWGGFMKFTYTPVMHGMLEFSPDSVRIVGLVNWFTVAFALLFFNVATVADKSHGVVFVLFLVGLLGLIYFIQSIRYKGLAKIASKL